MDFLIASNLQWRASFTLLLMGLQRNWTGLESGLVREWHTHRNSWESEVKGKLGIRFKAIYEDLSIQKLVLRMSK